MIKGAHLLLYSNDANADRAFINDILGFKSVDAGRGWLIFALPPAELAVHPSESEPDQADEGDETALLSAELYLMCDNVRAEVESLAAKGVTCHKISEAPWGLVTTIPLPSGGGLGLYQPKHPTALGLK